jgi:hypothetical protein
METAYQLSVDHNIWERPLGLMGTWGSLIEDWLDVLLPGDAAERCSGQVGLVVTQLPSCQQVRSSWERGREGSRAEGRGGVGATQLLHVFMCETAHRILACSLLQQSELLRNPAGPSCTHTVYHVCKRPSISHPKPPARSTHGAQHPPVFTSFPS